MKEQLSPRERQVLYLLMQDLSYKMISEMLHIKKQTVGTHTRHIKRKLGADTLPGMVCKAMERGYKIQD